MRYPNPIKTGKRSDEAFKRSAVEQWLSSGKPAETVAAELGISARNLRDWRRQYELFLLLRTIAELEAENRALRLELVRAKRRLDMPNDLDPPLPDLSPKILNKQKPPGATLL